MKITNKAFFPSTFFKSRFFFTDLFEINKRTGEIFTNADIDREKQSTFKLDIKASDNDPIEPKMNYTQISINVMDVNDNEPKFEVMKLDIKLREDVAINTEVAMVSLNEILMPCHSFDIAIEHGPRLK